MSQGASRWRIQRLRKAQLNEPSNGEDTTAERNNAFSGTNDVDDIDDSLPGAYAITNVMHGESEISLWGTNDIDTSTTNQVFPTETSTNLNENNSLEQEHRYLLIFLLSQSIQIYCYVVFSAIAVAIIVIGFNSSLISPAPSPTPSSTPSTITQNESPTSYQWNFNSEIVSDKVSFGYDVKLSADGNILVVSSPYHENGKGRFDVYTIDKGTDKITWNHLLPVSGTNVQGTNSSALMSHGMSLSADGSTVAIGSPGYGNGLVDIYMIDLKTNTISQKGNPTQGPSSLCEFGFSVALSSIGTRLFAGAPNYGQSVSERIGLVRAYDYNSVTDSWIQVGSDMTGESFNSRFGHSIASSHDGLKIIIGAPFDSTKFERAGKVYCFTLNKDLNKWYHFPYNYYYGDNANSQLGYNLVASESGEYLAFSVESSPYGEEYIGAGVIEVCYIGSQFNTIDTIGSPISGIHEDAHLGCQIDMDTSGAFVAASEQHSVDTSGTVWVYQSKLGIMNAYQPLILGYPKGSCQPRGRGPSVSIVTSVVPRLVIGYECALINGKRKSAVHVYDYYAISELFQYTTFYYSYFLASLDVEQCQCNPCL